MPLRLYNTQTGKKEDFQPLVPGKVGIYVCGVTVYDLCHIGHARSAVIFDVIFRYLRHAGYDVTYVRNFTDVDDKIINRANQEGIPPAQLAEKYIAAFYEDMDPLGVSRPTVEPRATGHIDGMIALIERLVERGHAYAVGGDVYFSVESFRPYGRLSGRPLDEMMSGARVEVDERKRSPLDFALWKSAKPGEPLWPSPWGDGRPGWHIECSVMSQKYLGETFDIHGGGKDLVFPHHENELAQSEAATGKTFARYWVHNGFVNVNHEKMSKSLGNFFTIREVLKVVHPEVLRFFLLSHHYRSPVDYCDANVKDAKGGLDRFYGVLGRIEEVLEGKSVPSAVDTSSLTAPERAAFESVAEMEREFEASMNDDFNTAEAIGHMHKCARQLGALLHEGVRDEPAARALLAHALAAFRRLGAVLGILEKPAKAYFAALHEEAAAGLSIAPDEIEALIRERTEARKSRNWARADEIRKFLLEKNVILEDGPGGTTWKVNP